MKIIDLLVDIANDKIKNYTIFGFGNSDKVRKWIYINKSVGIREYTEDKRVNYAVGINETYDYDCLNTEIRILKDSDD